MNDELKNIEKIDHYLSGLLSPEDRLAFENELLENEQLEKEVELVKAARNAVVHTGRADLKNKFDQFEKELETPVRQILPFRWMAAAAAVLVLLVAGIWFSKNNINLNDPEKIFADHFETYRNPILIRSGENEVDDIWQSAVNAYAKGEYGQAALLFQTSLNDSLTIGYLAHFYRGVSLLSQQNPNPEIAIQAFDQVLNTENDYRLQAMWYKGLSLIYLNKKEEAKDILMEIKKEGDYKVMEINNLLESISIVR
ncbi:MAG: hypothetical protein AAFZ15_16865 [Bacteroidota bacterium]